MNDVFSISKVNQLFDEVNLKLGDDYVIHMLQTEVLSLCITQKLKTVIAHCVMYQRKFISEKDVAVASQTECLIPKSNVCSRERGYLLNSEEFKLLCEKHIDVILNSMRRFDHCAGELKISKEHSLVFQELIEQYVRGFMEYAKLHCQQNILGYKHCSKLILELVGHSADD